MQLVSALMEVHPRTAGQQIERSTEPGGQASDLRDMSCNDLKGVWTKPVLVSILGRSVSLGVLVALR